MERGSQTLLVRYTAAFVALLLAGSGCGRSSSFQIEVLEEQIQELEEPQQESIANTALPAAALTLSAVPRPIVATNCKTRRSLAAQLFTNQRM
jgi:hypothetical protein